MSFFHFFFNFNMYIAAICSLVYLNPFGKHMVKSAELGVSIKYIQSATDDGPLK